jgi:hypothetical protein
MIKEQLNLSVESDVVENPSHSYFCPRFKGRFFINTKTNEYFPSNCKAYECPQCGIYKGRCLQQALQKYINNWQFVALWTFTYKTTIFKDQNECYKMTSKIWKIFITELRRCKCLSEAKRKTIYIKTLELTKKGFIHYHVLFGGYLPVEIVRILWQKAISQVTGVTVWNGNVFISKKGNKKNAGKYIAKYVTKALQTGQTKLRKWSKSNKASIFEVKIKNPDLINVKLQELWLILKNNSITSQTMSLYISNGNEKVYCVDENGEVFFESNLLRQKINKIASGAIQTALNEPFLEFGLQK